MMNTDASPASLQASRTWPLRPYTSSPSAHRIGSPLPVNGLISATARLCVVWNARSSGTQAARRRAWSSPPPLRHVHVEVHPGLPGRGDVGAEHSGHTVVPPADAPGMLRRHARRGIAFLHLRGLIDREPRP